jgi:pimeloyl-ACP methyl ester carboxylesterase
MILDRDGFGIHYEIAGRGPAVLLSHGFAASSHMFGATAADLERDHTVITWDLRGHARSDHRDDPAAYSVPLAVADMVALLDAAEAERAVAVGHSLGGYLTLELRLSRPERVAAMVLVDTGPGFRNDEGRAAWNRFAERYAADLREHGLVGLPKGPELRPDVHPSATGLAHAALGILRQRDASVLDSLPDIDVPTLVVVGELDERFLAGAEYMATKIPGAELAVIRGAGHAPPVSHHEPFTDRLRRFLASLPADP